MTQGSAVTSQATCPTALTIIARIGFGARGLIYLLVGAFAVAAAFNLGKQPHGIIDAVQAVTNNRIRLILQQSLGSALPASPPISPSSAYADAPGRAAASIGYSPPVCSAMP